MRYIISEQQNEKLKKYQAVKDIVDSYSFKDLVKTEFNLRWNNDYGFYDIEPTFYMSRDVPKGYLTVMKNELCDRIEDYLGIHIVSHNGHIKVIK